MLTIGYESKPHKCSIQTTNQCGFDFIGRVIIILIMEVLRTFIVKYNESRDVNKLAVLMQTKETYYIEYIADDGMGWSNHLKELSKEDAEKLII